MSVRRTPRRRAGITTLPGSVTVELDGPLVKTGRRLSTGEDEIARVITDEDAAALKEMLSHRWPTRFEDIADPTEELMRCIVERHGGVLGGEMPPPVDGGTWTQKAGYLIEDQVKEASQLHYALDVLTLLEWARASARSKDVDGAMRYAWMAGALAQEASTKFKWEAHALRGEKVLEGSGEGQRIKHDRAEADSAILVRRYESLRAASDERSEAAIYELIAAELKKGRLALRKSMQPSAVAVARRIQRYRRLLR